MPLPDDSSEPKEYHLRLFSEARFILLAFISLLSSVVVIVLLLLLVLVGFAGDLAFGLGFAMILLAPFGTYFLLRKRTAIPVIIRLYPDRIEIIRRGKSATYAIDMINSFEAGYELVNDDMDSVIFRDAKGKSVKIQASALSGSLREMSSFRRDFELWAEAHQLPRWSPWYRREWRKGKRQAVTQGQVHR
jgi:hypothetical protein